MIFDSLKIQCYLSKIFTSYIEWRSSQVLSYRGGSRIFSRGGGFSKNFRKFCRLFLGRPN